ncbi:nuclear protein MDM1-like isoform X3 [Branchiostoma floridae]|uniref:Nuclear protein MDM1 n=1 Tax=Branchiostoma floridae TaxID=7739 RepID=A0A9J7L3J4_BRAFL|nr:nuclear protein MDM1-like isoform X3 [Branchiostoma floridae]
MPVRFKGHSEYDTNYKWLESRKSAAYQPTREELAREAGLRSAELGILQEPPLQSKKRVAPQPSGPLHEPKLQSKKRVDQSPSGILHEPQMQAKKRVGTYAPTVPFALEWEDPLQPPDVVISKDPPVTEKVRESLEKMKTYKIEKKLREKEKRRREEKRRLEEKYDPPTPPAPRPDKTRETERPRERPREERVPERKPTKERGQGDKARQKQGDRKEEKGGKKDEGKEEKKEKRNRALEMKAGVKADRRKIPTMLSEYQRQFYEQQKLKDESPVMAADQMVYNSNPAMAPYRSDLIPRATEYNRQFKVPKRVAVAESVSSDRSRDRRKKSKSSKKERRARSLSPDRLPPAGKPTEFMPVVWNDPRPIKNFGYLKKSPHKLDNPHPKNWNWRSEYHSNYKSPTSFEYRGGTWRGADPPHLQPRKVMELRKKADDYRRRSHGTHFSRDHLLQLMARQNDMWDQSESESTVSALSLASDPVDKGHARRHQRPSEPPKRSAHPAEKPRPRHRSVSSSPEEEKRPVQRKLAWDEQGGGDRASRNRDRRDVVGRRRVRVVEDTDSESELGSESVTSIGSIPSQGRGSHASASYSENTSTATLIEGDDDDGRVATPELKQVHAPVRRHHYDRTTPAIGGALLVKSPPPARKHTSPAKTQPAHRPKSAPAPKPSRPAGKTYHVADMYRSLSPTAGQPTPDPYPLREDGYAPGSPMEQRYPARIRTQPVSASGQNGRPMTPPHLDDDRMSLISERSASSLSIASSVLERAQKRRDQFWGKGEQGR